MGGRRSEPDAGTAGGVLEAGGCGVGAGHAGAQALVPESPAASLFGRFISGLAGGNRVRDEWRSSFRGGLAAHSLDVQRTASADAKAAAAAEAPHEYRCWRSYVLSPDWPASVPGEAALPRDARGENPAEVGSAGAEAGGDSRSAGCNVTVDGDAGELVFDRFSLV